ncbi:bifunctional [glutamate--ammonia ligase]-adenylyl-L-tyrosine phosphorylase/[glutamate--ammonia-ligase] adenylyltransferase [Pseudoalteromonas denitrificans]|uniref:Bifunctional glutamine synthetase adenylyltransferase/adenylyl-removing enzyme n=1 Tax=Pseudoalteromonas denitrificans DSM 6059 TaxID=1123010 RepID=A0A1I1EAA9_9GAMM|nr:bifunctional [glutamate--ammonia ligase]-adenylyl-L-tyrosine phosphorylase/[glutamate--ammonia-ligase] adenylyltransferase [Pseudoalteromonas denitrificans]SFB81893.1 glutamate-ammonia-ligase adenylyltransferase [Pseudoalteromonas denitrificans DSM 6059]
MSINLSESLYQLGLKRFVEIYPNQVNDKIDDSAKNLPILQLLALSDFAYKTLVKTPELKTWLLDTQEIKKIDILPVLTDDQMLNETDQTCFKLLREYRSRYWLKVAFLDLVLKKPIEDSIHYISKLSDALIYSAYLWAYQQVSKINGKPLNEAGEAMPMLILGMGKLGGFELNYSSDIDLIFSYPEHCETQGGRRCIEAQVFFTKVSQKLISALNQVTPDGQVFRVDMRLRPFGDSGPLVLSFSAMEDYYQEQGRDWERYAMLKGRLLKCPIKKMLPDFETAYRTEFYALLRPFVYRRYIDFSVIESLRKMKSMIAQEVRRKGLKGNIKLGAGGIREVEFVVQAFQMIRGGRDVNLQTQSLLKALEHLVELGALEDKNAQNLKQGYLYLRKIEQYLQIFDNEQTQTLPIDEINQQRLTFLLAKPDYKAVIGEVSSVMSDIHCEFDLMVGAEKEVLDDDLALYEDLWINADFSSLNNDGFSDEEQVLWQSELTEFKQQLIKIKIGGRGRDTLDKLMPRILEQLILAGANQHIGVNIFSLINKVILKVASRTAYLELLFENQGTLKQLVSLCSHSKWIGEQLARYPILLDELIDPAVLYQPLELDAYKDEIRQYFLRIDSDDLEQQMEALRQFKQAYQLRIAAADATGVLDIMNVSNHLTALSEAIVEQSVLLAWQQMIERFGYPQDATDEDKGFAVIAYGKAGGIELGYGSDLDLVFLHNCLGNSSTNGAKQIDSRQFYLKLAQRLMHLFNTRTASGILYELDTRLRPEGTSGLLAINIETFAEYQLKEAWTWEHQALVRARMIFGQSDLESRFHDIRKQILSLPRNKNELQMEVAKMREKMRKHLAKGNNEFFDLKQDKGGMADIEFIAQFLVLANSHNQEKMMFYPDNIRIFKTAGKIGLISVEKGEQLIKAYCDYRDQYHLLSLRQQDKLVSKANIEQHKYNVYQAWQEIIGF